MTREEIYDLWQGIDKCSNLFNKDTIEFVYRLGTITKTVLKLVKSYEEVRPKNSDLFQEYIDAKTALMEEYAMRDNSGQILVQGQNIALTNSTKYKAEIKELDEQYKDEIAKHTLENDKFELFLKEEEDTFKFNPIPKKYIPTAITLGQFNGIFEILEQPNFSKE